LQVDGWFQQKKFQKMKSKAGVRVVVRVRPLKEETDEATIQNITDVGLELRNPRNNDELVRFNFDRCLGDKATQSSVFDKEILPFVQHALDGYNASCFCYGPTGAGKTHTMQGSQQSWNHSSGNGITNGQRR